FKAIQEGSKQRGSELSKETQAWGEALAGSLLAAHSGDQGWRNLPAPNRPVSANPWFLQERQSADEARGTFICSLPPGGEHLTGILRSETFRVPRELTFFIAGHDGVPGKEPQ